MIKLNQLRKIFNPGSVNEKVAIKLINLDVKGGEFITVVGSNGSGKTTLLNLIGGSTAPSEGSIHINEVDVTKEPEHKRAKVIGRIFQDPLLGTASQMTLEENMMVTSRKGFRGLRINLNNKARARFREELKKLNMDLEDRLKMTMSLFSGGQRQAMTLLMTVLSKPELILLDEHTAALDPKNAKIVMDLTNKFISDYKLTAIMVTHNMAQAIEYGNRLLMMHQGEIILDVAGEEKKNLTVDNLVHRFYDLRHEALSEDNVLLS